MDINKQTAILRFEGDGKLKENLKQFQETLELSLAPFKDFKSPFKDIENMSLEIGK